MKIDFTAIVAASLATAVVGATVISAPALAHHSFSGVYDAKKPFTITGTVVKYTLTNPHARILLKVRKPDGSSADFTVEMHSATTMIRKGMTRTLIKAGDKLVVHGSLARRDANAGFAQTVELPNGKKILVNEGLPSS